MFQPLRVLVSSTVVLLALLPSSAGAAERFAPHHVARLESVASAAISPDGSRIAYVRTVPRRPLQDEDGEARAELHVMDLEGTSRPWVSGKVKVSDVAWLPGGEEISFLAKRGEDEHEALWVISVHGGEARQVVEHGTAIEEYSWSPDGERVAFLATEPEDEERKELEERGFNQKIFEEDLDFVRVWIATPGGEKEPTRLDLEGSASMVHWSPAGDRLVVALAPTPLVDHELMRRRLTLVDVDSGEVVGRVEHEGKLEEVAWSLDGRHLAFIGGEDLHDPAAGRLLVVAGEGGKPRDVLPGYRGHVRSISWASDSELLYIGDQGVWTALGRVSADGSRHTVLVEPRGPVLGGLSLSRDGQWAAMVGETPRHPKEVYLLMGSALSGEAKGVHRLTDSNPWLDELRLADQEVVRYRARDGLELEGILIRALEAEEGEASPLILWVHGGPESHVRNGWLTHYSYPGQVAAARGMAVFYPNYRGSTGRGVEFSKLSQADAAGKEFEDLIDAIDHLVEADVADRERVGITGASYGGYASAWGATYYTEHFAAAVMFVGVSNQISKLGTSDIPEELYLVHHRKWMWEDRDYFRRASPVSYVEQARTPILILHGEEDTRVHPSQSLELYRHLEVLDRTPVRLVLYPGEGHGNRRAASRFDYSLRLMRWMEHYLKGPGGDPPPFRLDYREALPGLAEEEESSPTPTSGS